MADPMPTRRQTVKIAEWLGLTEDELMGPLPKEKNFKKPPEERKKTGPKKKEPVEEPEVNPVVEFLRGKKTVIEAELARLNSELLLVEKLLEEASYAD